MKRREFSMQLAAAGLGTAWAGRTRYSGQAITSSTAV